MGVKMLQALYLLCGLALPLVLGQLIAPKILDDLRIDLAPARAFARHILVAFDCIQFEEETKGEFIASPPSLPIRNYWGKTECPTLLPEILDSFASVGVDKDALRFSMDGIVKLVTAPKGISATNLTAVNQANLLHYCVYVMQHIAQEEVFNTGTQSMMPAQFGHTVNRFALMNLLRKWTVYKGLEDRVWAYPSYKRKFDAYLTSNGQTNLITNEVLPPPFQGGDQAEPPAGPVASITMFEDVDGSDAAGSQSGVRFASSSNGQRGAGNQGLDARTFTRTKGQMERLGVLRGGARGLVSDKRHNYLCLVVIPILFLIRH